MIGADAWLRLQLERGRATVTPAERASHPRIVRLSLSPAGPPVSIIAVAVISADSGQQLPLTATIEPSGRSWTVVAVGG